MKVFCSYHGLYEVWSTSDYYQCLACGHSWVEREEWSTDVKLSRESRVVKDLGMVSRLHNGTVCPLCLYPMRGES